MAYPQSQIFLYLFNLPLLLVPLPFSLRPPLSLRFRDSIMMACSLLSWSADNKCCLSISTCFCTKSNCLVFSVNRVSAMLVRLLSKSTSFRTLSETNCSHIWFFCRKLWEWWWAWKKKLISILFRSKSNAWIIRIPTKDSNLGTVCFGQCTKWSGFAQELNQYFWNSVE